MSQELYNNRNEMLEIINKTYYEDFRLVLDPHLFCSFVFNPKDQMFYFTDGMKDVLGLAFEEGVPLSVYSQYFLTEDRAKVTQMYDTIIKDLVIGVEEKAEIKHSLCKLTMETFEVVTSMRAVTYLEGTFIIGIMKDRTRPLMQRASDHFFGGDFSQYFFIYDLINDEIIANDRFVDDFAFEGRRIINFSRRLESFMSPEDAARLNKIIHDFIQTNEFEKNSTFKFLSSSKGEIDVSLNGLSDCDDQGVKGADNRYVSFSFTDITDFVKKDEYINNLLDGTSAITFTADVRLETISFSEKFHTLYPDMNLNHKGDIVEIMSEMVVLEDRKRFIATMNQVVDGNLERFSIEIRINVGDKITWIACRGKSFFDLGRQTRMIVGGIFDLTEMNQVREDVEKNDSIHELTGLPTRDKLSVDAENMIRDKGLLSAAIMLCDINDFHSFNDRYGRSAANEILIALVNLISDMLPEGATLYHIGIDIFAILWPHASRKMVTEFMETVEEEVNQPLDTAKGSFFISIGLSASIYPYSGSNIDELFVNAEIALHKVKQDKKLKYAIYSPVDTRELKERLDFEMQISQSIRNNMENFQLYYQPLVEAKTGRLEGAEALLRWVTPDGEAVNPERVVNALESTDQMEMVSEWILNEAISQCSKWVKGGAPKNFYVHINATSDDLLRKDYYKHVTETLAHYDLPAKNILIEITETSLMKNLAMCRRNLLALRADNVKIALDDFGTGYSSFNYLKELPVDEIKIDKSFVDDIEEIEFNKQFIKAITALVHTIRMRVVVEGVETEEQMKLIRSLGADIFQGYYFSKPLSKYDFENKYFNR